jgi:hypothetical protein
VIFLLFALVEASFFGLKLSLTDFLVPQAFNVCDLIVFFIAASLAFTLNLLAHIF